MLTMPQLEGQWASAAAEGTCRSPPLPASTYALGSVAAVRHIRGGMALLIMMVPVSGGASSKRLGGPCRLIYRDYPLVVVPHTKTKCTTKKMMLRWAGRSTCLPSRSFAPGSCGWFQDFVVAVLGFALVAGFRR